MTHSRGTALLRVVALIAFSASLSLLTAQPPAEGKRYALVVGPVGKDATKDAILEQFKAVGDPCKSSADVFLVSLSGHGAQFAADEPAYF